MQVPFPFGGVSEDRGYSDREDARDAKNVRGIDPTNGRMRGGARAGSSKFVSSQVNGTQKIQHLNSVTYAKANQTITDPGNTLTIEWSKTNTVTGDTLGIQCGVQGDVISLDGNCGVMKRNRDGALMWKVTLAATDKNHVCRALLVDAGTPNNAGSDFVLVGVSSGGDSTTAKAWGYQQQNDNKIEKVWELSPKGYVEAFAISKDKLFLLCNFPDRNRAEVIVYDDYFTNSPTEVNRWTVPYPATGMDSGPEDGFIFTSHNTSTDRDTTPQQPKSSWASTDWLLTDLASYRTRIWSNLDASLIETIAIEPRNLAYPTQAATVATAPPPDLLDGGNVRAWIDASGQGRSLFQTADQLPVLTTAGTGYTHNAASTASRGAIYKRNGAPNGKGALHFDGVTTGLVSEAPASKDKATGHDNLSLLPSYKGAQFAVFIVGRASIDAVRRGLICQGGTTANDAGTTSRWIGINSNPGAAPASTVGAAETEGQVCLYEIGVAATANSCSNAPSAPGGQNAHPLGGGLPDSGYFVISWICDGGIHDVPNGLSGGNPGTSTRSVFRLNGHPCDRWQSSPFSTTNPTQVGYQLRATAATAGFVGDIYEILVINDWATPTGTLNRLMGTGDDLDNRYPDAAFSGNQDSELARIEGYLAHKWGIAHELEGGLGSWLSITANPGNGETVAIGPKTYRFRTSGAGLSSANDVLIGATAAASLANLAKAVNCTGDPGTDYHIDTAANTLYRAMMPVQTDSTANHFSMCVRRINPNSASAADLTETLAAGSWSNASPQTNIAGSGTNRGWYPHPFFLERTYYTSGGPPRTAGIATVSNYWRLRSPYTILAAWDPASGKAKDVLTSNYDDTSFGTAAQGTSVGGIGYGVKCLSSGAVYSCGPRANAVAANTSWSANGTVTTDLIDARKIPWASQAFTLQGTGYWIWGSAYGSTTSPGQLTYSYPRLAVDKYDNLFLPYAGAGSSSLWIFAKDGSGGAAVVLSAYSGLTNGNDGYCVAVDPIYPDFTDSPTVTKRAEYCALGTQSSTDRYSVWHIRTLDTTQAASTPRATIGLAISGGQAYTFTSASVGFIGIIDSNAAFVDSTVFLGKWYVTDGMSVHSYDPKTATFADHVGTSSGGVPKRCAIIATWNNSLVLARQAENPNQYWISAQGDPGNWDIDPYTLTQSQAIKGSDGSAGVPPDIINAFIPYNDDLAFIGGDRTIFRLTGRPSPGGTGEIHLVSDSIGIAFGRAWCKDPKGYLYFFGSRGGVYRMAPGGIPEPLSSTRGANGGGWRSKIERRLQSIDLSAYRIEMAWNDVDKGFHVIVCPYGAGGLTLEYYFWEEATGAWWPDTYGRTSKQPTCIAVMDGDTSSDRVVLFGCEDGYIRKCDKSAVNDDGTAIDSYVLIGPLAPKETGTEFLFSQLEAVLANDQGSVWCNVYVTDRPDYLGEPVWSGNLIPGRNPWQNFRARGSFVFVELRSSDALRRWAFEQMNFGQVVPMGRKRAWSIG